MSMPPIYHTKQVRTALNIILSDPERGADALSRPNELSNLLSDYLPDCPKESGILLAAASVGLAASLRAHIESGMDPATAIHMASGSLADRTALTVDACQWVTVEIARALGIAPALPPSSPPVEATEVLTRARTQSSESALSPDQAWSGPRNSSKRAWLVGGGRQRLLALVLVVVVAAGTAWVVLAHHARAAASAPKLPPPDLARLLPATERVLHIYHVHLEEGQAPQVVITTTTGVPAGTENYAPQDAYLLAWDKYARRWTVLFDAARDQVNMSYEADADTDAYEASNVPSPAPLIPKGLGVLQIHVSQIRNQPGGAADLLIGADVEYADGFGQNIGIIHYNGSVARVVWAFLAKGGGSSVIGKPGHQRVAVTASWATESDPQCCPARSYQFILAKAQEPQIGEYYRVIADNRPWLGAIITEQPPQTANSSAIVVSVVPGSPAAGVLSPGDVIVGVRGSTVTSHGLGPAVFDQLAPYKPGQTVDLDIDRDGTLLTVTAKLGSLADSKAINAGGALSELNGTDAEYMI
jgi:hypothetical protein